MSDSPIERMMDGVEWRPIPGAHGDDLHATHEGILEIGEARLRCYMLSDGTRVLDSDDVQAIFGGSV